MQDIMAAHVETYNYIHTFGRQHWKNAFVGKRQYNLFTINVAECTNRLLKGTKVLLIVKHVKEIRTKLMEF